MQRPSAASQATTSPPNLLLSRSDTLHLLRLEGWYRLAPVSKALVFITISIGLIMVGISATSVSVAFPVITSSLGASLIQASWILSIYQLVSIAVMPLAGKLSDMFGNKRIFVISLFLFASGSALCAMAPNIQLLILSRFLQAVGGGAYFPVATGIVAEAFPQKRQQFIGLISSIYPVGQIIGPNLGAWLVTAFGWRLIFWLNVPLGLATLVLSAFLLKAVAGRTGKVDFWGVGLLFGSVFALLTGLSQIGNAGNGKSMVPWSYSALLLAAGVALLYFLVRHIKKSKTPIIEWQVLGQNPFLAANVYNFVCGAYYFGIVSFVPLYAVSVYGMSTLGSGLVLTPWSVGVMLAAALTSLFLVRWGYRKPLIVGNATVVIGLTLLALEYRSVSILGIPVANTALIAGITFLLGIGIGVVLPAANNACIELMPDRVASISGVRTMFRNVGGAFSITITSLLLSKLGNVDRGFTAAFMGLAVLTLGAFLAIFRMPAAP